VISLGTLTSIAGSAGLPAKGLAFMIFPPLAALTFASAWPAAYQTAF
jgi:hypothetical protein